MKALKIAFLIFGLSSLGIPSFCFAAESQQNSSDGKAKILHDCRCCWEKGDDPSCGGCSGCSKTKN